MRISKRRTRRGRHCFSKHNREQVEYNRYAPVLMTSVDTDPSLCAAERAAILQRLGAGEWKIFDPHGGMKEYRLREE